MRSGPLKKDLWIPGTGRAVKVTYATTDPFGESATSTGTIFVPKGKAPAGGWPVVSWAHGTSGLADACAPSRIGPALPERDFAYLGTWMAQGYAIVASDYVGLGTPGKHPYLDATTTAHSVVDMVKAAQAYSTAHLPARQRLSRKWVVIGQSQGGGAAIATASYATEFGGPGLDFRGGVGTGTPAYIELLVSAAGPGVLPVDASPHLSSYILYILAGMRYAHPELDIDSALSETGKTFMALAEKLCGDALAEAVTGTAIGDFFSTPLAALPGFVEAARDYMGMPETSFEQPVFLANGLIDTDVPMETTAAYVAVLTANGADVTFRTYPGDHNTTMDLSLPDSVPFVAGLFAS
ncbi:MAG: lipase [Actinobacteria bacterium]|nr:lipase [Actinomycetota bacterium]